MSEYQYYEFRAVDRPLSSADQRALRKLSTRATITAERFVNTYNWGDFKGDPGELMERYFDLFLYLADWGTRRLSIRIPARLAEYTTPIPDFAEFESIQIRRKGGHLILDLWREEIRDDEDRHDSEEWLDALAVLRAAAMEGDPGIFYLAWLLAVDGEEVSDDALEPDVQLGPVSAAIKAFVDFFGMDWDLIEAAADARPAVGGVVPAAAAERFIRALDDKEKTRLLVNLHGGDDRVVGAELRRRVRQAVAPAPATAPRRTVAELRARAAEIAADKARQAEERAAAARRQEEKRESEERARRLATLAQRGEAAWNDVEREIARRNEPGYNAALALLGDLRALAEQQGWPVEFARRLGALRQRHARKGRFIERLAAARM